MRLLTACARFTAYIAAWVGCWAGVGAVLTWRSFRQHRRTDWLARP